MDYAEKFSNTLESSSGLFLIAFGLLIAILCRQSAGIKWAGLSITAFVASLMQYKDEWHPVPDPLWGPIETLVQFGRPLAIVGLLFLALVTALSSPISNARFSPAIAWLFAAQIVLVTKLASGGLWSTAGLSLTIYLLLLFVMVKGVSRWLSDKSGEHYFFFAISGVAAFFVIVVGIQSAVDASAIVTNGRLRGPTGNAQHAAVLLATAAPAIVYQLLCDDKKGIVLWIKRLAFGSLLLSVVICLAWTGSRTGVSMFVIAMLVVLRSTGIFRLALAAFALGAVGYLLKDYVIEQDELGLQDSAAHILYLEDTRRDAWEGMWNNFLDNPLFGVPVEGDRLGFGESSWLAMGSTTGLIGLVPLSLFGLSMISLIRGLQRARINVVNKLSIDATIAGLLALVAGSFTEAYLLGIITTPLIFTQLYVLMGNHLIWLRRSPRFFPRSPAFQTTKNV